MKAVKFLPRRREAQADERIDDSAEGAARSSSPSDSVSYLLSGADDQHLKVWRLLLPPDGDASVDVEKVECVQTVHAHSAAINCIAIISGSSSSSSRRRRRRRRGEPQIFATGAADASVRIWSFDATKIGDNVDNALVLLQTIKPNPKLFPLALALSELDEKDSGGGGEEEEGEEDGVAPAASTRSSLVLAVAGTRDIVQIYVADIDPSNRNTHGDQQPEELFHIQATLSGHEGWIRSLDFAREETGGEEGAGGDLMLASASQDKYIRLWRFHAGTELPAAAASDPADPASIMGRAGGGSAGVKSPSNKAHRLKTADGKDYSITFEALLLGHDDWIYSAKWRPTSSSSSSSSFSCTTTTITNGSSNRQQQQRQEQKLQLLSASADNTLAIWEADPSSGIWVTAARLGEISREKGATTATGSTGGFWTGLWGATPDGARSVACLGRTGSWRVWALEGGGDESGGFEGEGRWMPRVGITGHTRAVTGIAWNGGDGEGEGAYLLSTSGDQTTRLHAPWGVDGSRIEAKKKKKITWHEMARPQIHGYDLNCVDSLGSTQFVSGADEKLMRVFDEPRAVARLLRRVCGITSGGGSSGDGTNSDEHLRPDAADMPVLGLSNKAVVEDDDNGAPITTTTSNEIIGQQQQPKATTTTTTTTTPSHPLDHLTTPPPEEMLSRNTLWPEAEKLYGHGYEVSCLAGSHSGRLVASACRASSANHAVIRIFETAPRWSEVRPPLAAHSLTATRLRFSPRGDRFLLSVGRDRVWAVFERVGGGGDRKEGEGDGDRGGDGENEEGEGEGEVGAERDGGAPVHDEGRGIEKEKEQEKNPSSSSSSNHYKLLQSNPKGHSRMILDAAWAPAPLAESQLVFATAGRDKQVKIWRRQEQQQQHQQPAEDVGKADATSIVCAASIPESHPVTAVDFLPRTTTTTPSTSSAGAGAAGARLVLAVGTEAGKVSLYGLDAATLGVSWSLAVRPE